MLSLHPEEEYHHQCGPDVDWQESWYLDFWDADALVGGYFCLTIFPNRKSSWLWACLVGNGRPLVTVIEFEAPLPKLPSLEVRSSGLWADLIVETPITHTTLGFEAFGVAIDDPVEMYSKGWGVRTPLGFDLEWETNCTPFWFGDKSVYELPCRVHGEILVDTERIKFDGNGRRRHEWGLRDWWSARSFWSGGRLDDGRVFHVMSAPSCGLSYGSVGLKLSVAKTISMDAKTGVDGFVTSAHLQLDELGISVEPIYRAPVLLVNAEDARVSHLDRSLVRFVTTDGFRGVGWFEFNQPQA